MRFVWLVFLLVASIGATQAQDKYPSRAVRVIVPFAPGGGADIMARAVGAKLSERLGQQFVVDNRPGAGGNVGIELAARAAPDGYTLMVVSSSYGVNPSVHRITYDPVDGFEPITQISQQPNIVALHPSVQATNVRELIALAKAKPGTLTYASSGTGGVQHMGTELFKSMAGIDILHIPYKGTGPALNDVMAGQVQLIFGSIIATLPHVKSGKLRGIAVTGLKRADAAPEIPTVDESGLPGYSFTGWYVMLAPAKTPRPIVMLLNREVVRSLQMPELKDRLAAEGSTVVAGTPEELRAHLRREVAKWMKVVKTANIGLDAAR